MIICRVCVITSLEMGDIIYRMLEASDWMKIDCKIGARTEAQDLCFE